MARTKDDGLHIAALIVLAGPFYLNDFASIYVADWVWWLFIDYTAVKLLPLLVVAWLIRSGRMQASEFGLTKQSVPLFLLVFVGAALVGTIIDQNGYAVITKLPGYPSLGGMPTITDSAWNWIDLTLGLLLVAICEELVFRGYLCAFISRYTRVPAAIVVISALAFGLIHWSLGLHAILITATIGAVFMAVYLKTQSLPAIALAHFVINFIDFAAVIPKSVFKLV